MANYQLNLLGQQVQSALDQVATNTSAIGDLSDLETTDKDNLVAAINEAAQSGTGITMTSVNVTLPTSGWVTSGTLYRYSPTVQGVTPNDVVFCQANCTTEALADDWANVINVEVGTDYVTFVATSMPSATLSVRVVVFK